MRKRTFYALVAIVIASVPPAGAMPSNAGTMRQAAEQVSDTESVACYGFGWRGWGIYPGWYPACSRVAPVYAPGYLVAASGLSGWTVLGADQSGWSGRILEGMLIGGSGDLRDYFKVTR